MCWYKQPSCVAAAAQLSLKRSQSLTCIYLGNNSLFSSCHVQIPETRHDAAHRRISGLWIKDKHSFPASSNQPRTLVQPATWQAVMIRLRGWGTPPRGFQLSKRSTHRSQTSITCLSDRWTKRSAPSKTLACMCGSLAVNVASLHCKMS